ncbi:hypothetical protein, partial [Sphingopyxis soli]|uniref:hypothetical protein n=1 Tax=Sphingopyxis soli TaxID=592051 RepID=UPI001BFE3F8B
MRFGLLQHMIRHADRPPRSDAAVCRSAPPGRGDRQAVWRAGWNGWFRPKHDISSIVILAAAMASLFQD